MKGEYAKANMLSKKAKEERIEAERLHNEAAKKIFEAQNTESKRELWELDLHGLHVNEAVAALRNRLLHIEALLSENNCASEQVSSWDSNGSGSTTDKIAPGAEMVAEIRLPSLPFGRRLNVITGINFASDPGNEKYKWTASDVMIRINIKARYRVPRYLRSRLVRIMSGYL